jgi:hypothetical protein
MRLAQVTAFSLLFSLSLSFSNVAHAYNGLVSIAAATSVGAGICAVGANHRAISSAAANNVGTILKSTVGAFVASVVWETAAKKITGNDNTPYRFSHLLAIARDKAIKPFWEHAGYGFAMGYDVAKSTVKDVVVVGGEYVDALVVTPYHAVFKGSNAYCSEHGLDQTSANRGVAAMLVGDAVVSLYFGL